MGSVVVGCSVGWNDGLTLKCVVGELDGLLDPD